jgi:hypothetical protein
MRLELAADLRVALKRANSCCTTSRPSTCGPAEAGRLLQSGLPVSV